MSKDPAILFFIDNWLVSTKEMKADERGWYLNLILHQFDKGDLPNDIEELANLADVRFSEFDLFKQKWEQVLKQKFKQNENGRLSNEKANDILKKRELFKSKRSESGKIGYVVKFAINELGATEEQVEHIKNTLDFEFIDTKNKQVLKQVLKQTIKLYINGNRNINKDTIEGVQGEKEPKVSKSKYADFVLMLPQEYDKLKTEFGEQGVNRLVEILNNYKGSKGKQYKSDYLAIRNWVVTRYNEEKNKPTTASPKNVNQYWENVN